jgi:hypothetical protein
MTQDSSHIKILSIFHFVVAGMVGLIACFPIFHLAIGISMLTGNFGPAGGFDDAPFPFNMFGVLFTVIPALFIFFGWALAICIALAGLFLAQKKHYLFCFVIAGVECTFTPLGTVLGVFTMLVLLRPSVQVLFGQTVNSAPSA